MAKKNKSSREIRTRFRELRLEYNERHDKQITQKDMAKEYYVAESEISRVERGAKDPQISVLYAYAEKFGVTIEYLLGYSEAKSYENATIGHELGLSDEAIETLKFIKNYSHVYSNAVAVINAFLSQDNPDIYSADERSSFDACSLFSGIFDSLLSEYATEQQGYPDAGMFESNRERAIKQYINKTVRPALRKDIEEAYRTPRE